MCEKSTAEGMYGGKGGRCKNRSHSYFSYWKICSLISLLDTVSLNVNRWLMLFHPRIVNIRGSFLLIMELHGPELMSASSRGGWQGVEVVIEEVKRCLLKNKLCRKL